MMDLGGKTVPLVQSSADSDLHSCNSVVYNSHSDNTQLRSGCTIFRTYGDINDCVQSEYNLFDMILKGGRNFSKGE